MCRPAVQPPFLPATARTDGDIRIHGTFPVQQRCQDCPLDDDQSKRPANSNSKPGEPGLARERPASTNGDLRLGGLCLYSSDVRTAHWTKINPKKPANSNSKPGEPGLARERAASTNGNLRLGDFAWTVAMPGCQTQRPILWVALTKTANNKELLNMESHCHSVLQ